MTKDLALYKDIYDCVDMEQESSGYFSCGCQLENVMWLFNEQRNLLVAYDMQQDRWEQYNLSIKIDQCAHMVEYNNMLYILDAGGVIYCWDIAEKLIELFADCRNNEHNIFEFARIVVTDKKFFLLPSVGESIFEIALDTRKANLYCRYPIGFQYIVPKGCSKYYGYCEDEDNYFYAMRTVAFILRIGKRDGEIQWIKPEVPLYKEYMKTCIKYGVIFQETEYCSNKSLFINDIFKEPSNQNYANVGVEIWENIKDIR